MKPLSKIFYFGMIAGGLLLTTPMVLFLVAVYAEGRGADRDVVPFLMLPAMLPAIIGMAVSVGILVYKMWTVIQGGQVRTTPGLAVGLLFVPCFNLFWGFQAYWGWTKDYNRYIAERNLSVPRMPEGLALTVCILTVASIIPFLGSCLALINIVLLFIFMNSAINGVNALITASPKLAAA
jgi:hypothetical protein